MIATGGTVTLAGMATGPLQTPGYISRPQAARFTSLSASFLAHAVTRPDGPPFTRVGRRVMYKVDDLVAWLDSHSVRPRRRRGRPPKERSTRRDFPLPVSDWTAVSSKGFST